ncbi:GGDEF domain-containing response regulator [Desulfobotulus mexicanus]|uniref:diguanylate cyclase n=1 Tax=Desulfobotulus mexicanus TaxID=2586642 RepID=A0A5Q4VFI7_9BACT|nr:diguanylate cyclase [Desulfobotulus mexicanus]TYT74920.1 diguanylate cyclase [Desulfobotulus mexicanus]
MTRILVVDDDSAIRSAMETYISLNGFHTVAVSSAEEAMDHLRQCGPMDVVITDIMMEGMSGLELTEHIRATYDTDVIIMTGYSAEYSYEEAIRRGASDIIFKPARFEEILLRLKRVLRERKLTQEREVMLAKLQELSITDELTRLFNSRHFYSRLEKEVERFHRYQRPLSLLLLDIDYFKDYNDSHGHLEGDRVLMRMGAIIKNSLRIMDSAYRYGGEEFTVLLPETEVKEALVVAQRIQEGLASEKFFPASMPQPVYITVSIGITEYITEENLVTFIQRADMAMYCSKKNGRNQITTLMSNDCRESMQCLKSWSSKIPD